MQLTTRPDSITRTLCRLVVALTAAHVLGQVSRWGFGHDSVFGLVPLFDLNDELNVPTFFSSLLLTGCAALMAVCARVHLRKGLPGALHWAGLSAVLLFLALDEFASLHERLSDPVRSSLDVGGVLTSAWVIPYGLAALLIAGSCVPFLRSLPTGTRCWLMAGGATFVTGAVGMEMLAGPAKEAAAGAPSLSITLFTTVEEVLEMLGVVLCIHGLGSHLVAVTGGLDLRLEAYPGEELRAESGSAEGGSSRARRGLFGLTGRTSR